MKRLTTILLLFLFATGFATAQEYSKAYLGIYSEQISKQKAELLRFDNPYGNYVTGVVEGTPAQQAGLQPLDYIYGIGDEMVGFTRDMSDLLSDHKAGEASVLRIVRKGKNMDLPITFGARSNQRYSGSDKEEAFLGVSPHAQNAAYNDKIGVKIYVVDNSTAMEMGMQDGDVITSINGHTMVDWRDISIAINMLKVGDEIEVGFMRNGKSMQASTAIKSENDTRRRQVIVSEYKPQDYGYLGIYSNTISDKKAEKLDFENAYGSYVTRVVDNTAAAEAGLQPFDYVYGIDDYRTNKDESLTKILKRYAPGDQVTLHFIRAGKAKTKKVTLGSRKDSESFFDLDQCETPLLGVREYDGSEDDGVTVQIVRRSTAEAMGMENGDVIISINGHPIIDWNDISAAVDNMKVGETVQVAFLRNGKQMTVENPIKSYCDTHPEEGRSFSFNFDMPEVNVDMDDEAEERYDAIDDTPIRDVDVSSAIVDLKDMSAEEAEEIRARFGIEMLAKNDLQITNLNVFPNAETGKYELQFNLPQKGETKISVYNAAGRQIYEYDLGSFSGDFRDHVDISQNGIGNYYLEIRQGNKTLAKKILLQTR